MARAPSHELGSVSAMSMAFLCKLPPWTPEFVTQRTELVKDVTTRTTGEIRMSSNRLERLCRDPDRRRQLARARLMFMHERCMDDDRRRDPR